MKKFTWQIADKVAHAVMEKAEEDVGKQNLSPDLQSNARIAVCVCGLNFQPKVTLGTEDTMSVSNDSLCEDKAYTVLRTGVPTLYWELKEVNMRNFGDPRFTGFAGAVPVKTARGKLIGAIGVSGRKSCLNKGKMPIKGEPVFLQDHELAEYGLKIFKQLVSKKSQPQ